MVSYTCDRCKDVYTFKNNAALYERHTGETLGMELPDGWWLDSLDPLDDHATLLCTKCQKETP